MYKNSKTLLQRPGTLANRKATAVVRNNYAENEN